MNEDDNLFEWDEAKSQECFTKRGFDFSIVHAFDFDGALFALDDRRDYGETRVRAYNTIERRYYCITFTKRGSKLRIISVRHARDKEIRKVQKLYNERTEDG